MFEGIAHGALDDAGSLLRRQFVLGLSLEFGLADKDRQHRRRRAENIVCRNLPGTLVAGQFSIITQALGQRRSEAGFMGSALGRGHGVAIGIKETIRTADPGNRPFDRSMTALLFNLA